MAKNRGQTILWQIKVDIDVDWKGFFFWLELTLYAVLVTQAGLRCLAALGKKGLGGPSNLA